MPVQNRGSDSFPTLHYGNSLRHANDFIIGALLGNLFTHITMFLHTSVGDVVNTSYYITEIGIELQK